LLPIEFAVLALCSAAVKRPAASFHCLYNPKWLPKPQENPAKRSEQTIRLVKYKLTFGNLALALISRDEESVALGPGVNTATQLLKAFQAPQAKQQRQIQSPIRKPRPRLRGAIEDGCT